MMGFITFLDILSMFPNIYKRAKVWQFQFDEVLFFGSGNASGKLRFTNYYDPIKNYVS